MEEQMEEERIYKSILIKDDGTYLGWEPGPVPEGSGMQAVEWNKPLPEAIDSISCKYNFDTKELERS